MDKQRSAQLRKAVNCGLRTVRITLDQPAELDNYLRQLEARKTFTERELRRVRAEIAFILGLNRFRLPGPIEHSLN